MILPPPDPATAQWMALAGLAGFGLVLIDWDALPGLIPRMAESFRALRQVNPRDRHALAVRNQPLPTDPVAREDGMPRLALAVLSGAALAGSVWFSGVMDHDRAEYPLALVMAPFWLAMLVRKAGDPVSEVGAPPLADEDNAKNALGALRDGAHLIMAIAVIAGVWLATS